MIVDPLLCLEAQAVTQREVWTELNVILEKCSCIEDRDARSCFTGRHEAQQRGAFVDLTAECDCVVDGRRELLHRAIENVVGNGVRYTKAGTKVEIGLRQDNQNRMSVMEASDRGPGIPESELASVFRPFYMVDAARSPQSGGRCRARHR